MRPPGGYKCRLEEGANVGAQPATASFVVRTELVMRLLRARLRWNNLERHLGRIRQAAGLLFVRYFILISSLFLR